MKQLIDDIMNWPRPAKYVLMLVADAFVYAGSFYVAIAIYYNDLWPSLETGPWTARFVLGIGILLGAFAADGMYKQMVRHAGAETMLKAAKSVTIAIAFCGVIGVYTSIGALPPAAMVVLWAFLLIGTAGIRIIARALILSRKAAMPQSSGYHQRVAIYGAGLGGLQLLEGASRNRSFDVVAFFDDDLRLAGREIKGIKVYPSMEIARLIGSLKLDMIILAMPSISRARRRDILSRLESLGIKVQTLPSMNQLLGGRVTVDQVQDVSAGDLLWRNRHAPDRELMAADVHGRSVMVTGAGGSIGSELCRQAIKNGANRLTIMDISEFALYKIEQELTGLIARSGSETELVEVLGDCRNREATARVMRASGVETVYHAAAYKHVPIVEHNPCSGVGNNVFGTLATARAAIDAGARKFVLISTDKAVRPTNIMGASKRLAEMTLQGLHAEIGRLYEVGPHPKTRLSIVRFGNVLDSAGSVVPLFRQQIREGGPITLTHREVTRFFMTIPEAAQLVLQASAMSKGGEVFVLDMGEPVKIHDLARRMVHLSGLTLAESDDDSGDIRIEITGMRPGEKLFEEMFIGNNISSTAHPAILRAEENFLPWSDLTNYLDQLSEAVEQGNGARLKDIMTELVEGYASSDMPFVERRKWPRLSVVSSSSKD